ncbi:MAG: hypothetical protein FH761_13515 [Firmicutes bacterium]|nr:hypothetical protein [Bacillota bacterium]
MTRKRKRSMSTSKFIMVVTSVAMLNAMGISYAYWNDGLNINTTVTTGRMSVSVEGDKDFNDTIKIKDGEKYTKKLNYTIINEGSIPIRLSDIDTSSCSKLNISTSEYDGILNPEEEKSIAITLETDKPGEYPFDIILNYKQWNR